MIHTIKITFLALLISNQICAQEQPRYWIFFKDKGTSSINKVPGINDVNLSRRAIERRIQKSSGQPFDFADLPLESSYLEQIKKLGVTIYRRSRWFNGISIYLNRVEIDDISSLPFVKSIKPVRSFKLKKDLPEEENFLFKIDSADYGGSENQNTMIGIDYGHNLGYHGEGVLIALFDSGFLLEHEALQHINPVATWDFVQNDAVVSNEEGDVNSQHNHGSMVLSTIAGYKPGKLIGPAYGADFLLAKTEDIASETHVEEDNWAAAVEWAEGLGADIISTSLGYDIFDNGEGDYSFEDMDGNTTIITRAADMAVKKGIAVFTSAGNEGTSGLTAPADGDSVLAIGSVDSDGTVSSFSSRGPSYDGRIKPDLMAQGRSIYTISPNTFSGYSSYSSGTSFACPLAAGAGAIILSIHHDLTPMELKDLLIFAASQYNSPDNTYGYGIINLKKSIQILSSEPMIALSSFNVKTLEGRNIIEWIAETEVRNREWIITREDDEEIKEIARIKGNILNFVQTKYSYADLNIRGGEEFSYNLYALFEDDTRSETYSTNVVSLEPETINLFQNFPNPFNPNTQIIFSLTSPEKTSLKIYNVNGQLIKTIIDNINLSEGFHHPVWDGRNDSGKSVASGNYFAILKARNTTKVIKLMYIR